jgi:hypothetical protein
MNDSSSLRPQDLSDVLVQGHVSIPSRLVAIGAAAWGGAPRQAGPFEVSVMSEEPERFSARAKAAGRLDEARELEMLEGIGMLLSAQSAPSRFNPEQWERVLRVAGYPEHALGPLLRAIRQGASIDPDPTTPLGPAVYLPNHASLYAHIPFVLAKLGKQITARTLMAWPDGCRPHVVAPLGVVAKFKTYADHVAHNKWLHCHNAELRGMANRDVTARQGGSSGDGVLRVDGRVPTPPRPSGSVTERLIHDARQGVNDRGEPPTMGKLDTLRQIAQEALPGDFTWVEDVSGAFKLVKILGWQTILTGTALLGATLVDTCLTFGLNTSPQAFQAAVGHPLLWTVLHFLAVLAIAGHVFQYVDDHIGLARSLQDARRQRAVFRTACRLLNIPLEDAKTREPAQSNLILGLILHTKDIVRVECPKDKLDWIREILTAALRAGSLTVKELETVCGMIGFIGVSIHGAFVFSAELRDAMRRAKAQGLDFVGLTAPIRGDIAFWQRFAEQWNGLEVILARSQIPAGHLSADAMTAGRTSAIGLFACGRGFRVPVNIRKWEQGPFKEAATDIAILELIAFALQVIIAAALFPGAASALSVACVTDNSTVRRRVEKGWCRDPHANAILRFVWRVSTFARVNCSVSWIPSGDNALSDAPSRGDQHSFSRALVEYHAHRLSNSSVAPAWWPRHVRYEPAPGRAFAACDSGSAFGAVADDLGTVDITKVPIDDQEVAGLLQRVRALFN